jgi:hypothetical protein
MIKNLFGAALLSFTLAAGAGAQPPENPTFEFSETLLVRVAFYEKAPAGIAVSMRKAVKRQCAASGRPQLSAAQLEWLCAGRHLNFLRSVNVLGQRQSVGFVCNDDGISPNMKYFLDDMFADNPDCVFVAFNAKTNEHFLDLGDSNRAP